MGHRLKSMILGSLLVGLVCLLTATGAWSATKTYHLKATTGTVIMPPSEGYPSGESIPIWGFVDCGTDATCASVASGSAMIPGPVLDVPPGDSLEIQLYNDLPEPVSIMVAGQNIIPSLTTGSGQSYTDSVPVGGSAVYWFNNPKPGTYLYESGTNQSKQVQMGLYGSLIVRGGTPPAHDREAVIVLSDLDPYWHAAVQAGQAYNAVYFNPKYWLINGKAYPDTKEIFAIGGEKVLLRYVNAGSQDHVMVIQGMNQTQIADDGNPVAYPLETSAVIMNPGQTQDLLVQPTFASSGNNLFTNYPIYDRRLDITNRDHFPGGMISMIRVLSPASSGLKFDSTPIFITSPVGSSWNYDLVAVDASNLSGSLTYTLISGPAGVSVDPVTGRITWSSVAPMFSFINVSVSNGITTISKTIIIAGNENPVFEPVACGVNPGTNTAVLSAGQPFNCTVQANDPEGLPVTYSFADPFTPLTINPNTGVISGVPIEPVSQTSHTYTIQVQANDPTGGVGLLAFYLEVQGSSGPVGGGGTVGTQTVTISPVEYGTGTPITDFKFTINQDNAYVVDPATQTCDPKCPVEQYESNSPVVAVGTVTAATPQSAVVTLPEGRYIVTVVAGQCTPDPGTGECNPATADLEMRNGGTHKLDSKHFALPGPGTVQVELHAGPLPLSKIKVQVFQDVLLNAAWDMNLEGAPSRNGVPDRFTIVLKDLLGSVTQDGLGNPICSQYDNAGEVIPGTGGVCLTDENGFITIDNMPTNKYAVLAIPPDGSGWVQTTTIEGTKAIDAWAEEGNTGLLPEEIGLGSYLIYHGFLRACTFGDPSDDCPTNNTLGAGTIRGQIVKLQASRPPFMQPDGLGDTVKYPWVALNNLSGNGEYVALVRGDENGNFIINNVPDGLYQAVIWDDPQDHIISFYTVSMPQVTMNSDGTSTASYDVLLKDPRFAGNGLPIPDWYGHMNGSVYLDNNENGLQDNGEPGLPLEAVEVRHRDGSLLYATMTDGSGKYDIKEFFPWMHWMVAGIGYTRLGDTGLHVIAGSQLPKIGQSVVEERIDMGPVLTIGTLNWAAETNELNWGKKPYPIHRRDLEDPNNPPVLCTDPGAVCYDNGGISGAVWYATTRNERDVRFAAADDWEPGIPNLYLNLYERLIDPTTGKTMMEPPPPAGTGAAVKGRYIGRVITDYFNRPDSIPSDCGVLDPNGSPVIDAECTEIINTWNQIKSGIWDGAYQFFYDQSDLSNPGTLLDCDVVGVGSDPGQCRALPAGTYLVELEMPANYLLVTENDRNVIDQGDAFERVQPLKNPSRCVGALYEVVDPAALNFGAMVPKCDVKEVVVEKYENAPLDFHIFTEVPIPGHLRGFVNDNINIEARKFMGWYGDKAGVPFVPVSIRDFKGKELARVYTDKDGHFDVLLPSTNRVNVPTPSGVAPNVVWAYANDPGSAQNPDPYFNINYNTLIMAWDIWPGRMVLADMALTPVNGFLANQIIDCGPGAETPQVSGVSEPRGDNSGSSSFTIEGSQFGTGGRATLNGSDLVINSWTNTSIGVTIPAGFADGPQQLLVIRGDNANVSPTGMTIHVTGSTYNPAFISTAGTVQAAVDAAAPGDVVLVPPGQFWENVIVYKPITLQGYGPGKTTINGVFFDPVIGALWSEKMTGLIASGTVSIANGQPVGNLMPTIMVMAQQGGVGQVRIDGISIEGARNGGGVHVNSFADHTEISNNLIQNNFGSFTGGIGIGFPNFGDNQIAGVRIHHNDIRKNGSLGQAGGIGIFHGANDYEVDHNLICSNGTTTSGGGLSQLGTTMGIGVSKIHHNDILFNWTFNNGGGISLQGPPVPLANLGSFSQGTGPVDLDDNRIQGNYATLDGGGISLRAVGTYPIRMTNNIIVNNLSTSQGGGISVQDASNVQLVNNTVAKNNSTSTNLPLEPWVHSAGMVIHPNTAPFQSSLPVGTRTISDVLLFNNIFWQNIPYTWDNDAQTLVAYPTAFDLGIYIQSTQELSRVRNNMFTTLPAAVNPSSWNQIGVDPQFAGSYDLTLTGAYIPAAGEVAINPLAVPVTVHYSPLAPSGDYHVLETSPALEYGGAEFPGTAPVVMAASSDFDDQARPINECIDTGADERPMPSGSLPTCSMATPVASIAPASGNEGASVLFDASSSTPPSIISYAWDFGDGSPVEVVSVPTIPHVYQDDGLYTVSLNVITSSGLSAGTTVQASIANVVPVANAGPDDLATSGLPYTFSGTASDPGSLDQAAGLQYAWDFGDGTSASGTLTPSHTFVFDPLHTSYTVTLTVTDKDLGEGTDTVVITRNSPPVISSVPVVQTTAGLSYAYQVVATDAEGHALTYSLIGPSWLSINSLSGFVSGNPTNSDAGNHPVMVTVTDSRGASVNQSYTLEVLRDVIFADGFESGSFSAWTGPLGSGAGNMTLRKAGASTIGQWGTQVWIGAGPAYLTDLSPNAERTYHARFFFDPNGVSLGTGVQTMFAGVQGGNHVFRVQFTGNVGTYGLRIQARTNAGTYAQSAWLTGINDDVHTIEVSWDASNGSMSLMLDERRALRTLSLAGVANSLQRVDEVRLGWVAAFGISGQTGYEYFDDFVSTRYSAIGSDLLQMRFGGTTIDTASWNETDPLNILTQNQKLIWSVGAATNTRAGRLDGLFPVTGDFDVNVEFNLPAWNAPTGTASRQSLSFVLSSVMGSNTLDPSNRLTVSRIWTTGPSYSGYESVATVGGVSTQVKSSTAWHKSGFLRFSRSGAVISAYYWDLNLNDWILLNTVTLPAGPILLSVEGGVSGGTSAVQMEMDTLKVTAGSVTIP